MGRIEVETGQIDSAVAGRIIILYMDFNAAQIRPSLY
jgi:hypothetical protein